MGESRTEVVAVADRCKECGGAVRVLVLETWTDDEGAEGKALYGDGVPHTRRDCETMKALEKEQWPTLW